MSLILLLSILIRVVALGWSIRLLVLLRDWRMGFLSAMLALMALRQTLTLAKSSTSLDISITAQVTELPGLAVSVLAFLSVLFLEHIIVERRAIRRALRASEERLRQAQKMEAVGRLAGGVAHDFNNILTAILGYSEILASRVRTDAEAHDAAMEIHKAGVRAADLTRQLLAFGRKQNLRPEIVDLNAIVSDLESMLRRLIGEHIEFRTRLDDSIGAIHADRSQIEQVIVNLAVNARDALGGGGVLQISTSEASLSNADLLELPDAPPGRYVCLSVSDTGEGMDAETLTQIFEPFFTRKAASEGTGLGLATVFGIVRQSGGAIRVQSEPGAGATFDVLLPRVDVPTEAGLPTPAPKPAATEATSGSTVLLVEDDAAVLRLARSAVEAAGYTVLAATSAEAGVKIAKDHPGPIDLLVTDVVMRGMSGIELAAEIREERPGIAVVFMSGYSERLPAPATRAATSSCFLAKPFSAEQLVDALAEARLRSDPRA